MRCCVGVTGCIQGFFLIKNENIHYLGFQFKKGFSNNVNQLIFYGWFKVQMLPTSKVYLNK